MRPFFGALVLVLPPRVLVLPPRVLGGIASRYSLRDGKMTNEQISG